ncbi:MAG: tetratricopeptide repeat protein [Planctomycetota bacterium]
MRRTLSLALILGFMLPADGSIQKVAEQQAKLAKAAVRDQNWAAAEQAWELLLEFDPRSLQALQGLVEVAQAKGDADAEIVARLDWNAALAAAIADGESAHRLILDKSLARVAELDPERARAGTLLEEYGRAQAEIARRYLAAGMPANALEAWKRRLSTVAPGSPEAAEAHAATAEALLLAPDHVARRFQPLSAPLGRDEAWIAEHDKRTAKWSNAAKWETPHYRIKTNAGWVMGTEVAAVMEQAHAFYREIWGIVPDPPPAKVPKGLRELSITPIEVNIYATLEEYRKRAGDGALDWSAGNFTGTAVNTYDHSGKPGSGSRATLQTLFHEASHQFMSVAVGNVPSFVNEGIASLFEGIEILSNGNIRRDLPVPGRLAPLAQKLARGTAMPLREVMNALENKPELYDYRWGFMYFLRMYVDEQGQYVFRDRLQDYMYEFKSAAPGDMVAHFQEFVLDHVKAPGIASFADFERTWKAWILALEKERTEGDKRLDEFRNKGRLAWLKDSHAEALRFYERALDLSADDLDSLFGSAQALAETGEPDRAVVNFRRFLELAEEDDRRRVDAEARLLGLDPEYQAMLEARRAYIGGMLLLAREYDEAERPRCAVRAAQAVLELEPFEAGARALMARLEREAGVRVARWQRLFNGFDIDGWYGAEGGQATFFVKDGELLSDSRRTLPAKGAKPGVGGASTAPLAPGTSLYQALLLDRAVDGDWSAEAHIRTEPGWQIAGLIFGARDTEHYEAVVLRNKGADGVRAEFASFDSGTWSFRGDGAFKASYDAVQGVALRVDVRGREVSVLIDGQPLQPIVGGKVTRSIKYPLAALRGDIGLLASAGVTRFRDVRLLTGRSR